MKNERIILAGGSGFLGRSLARELEARGCEVIILTRHPKPDAGARKESGGIIRELQWDGRTVGTWASFLEGARAVVNLTGRSVNCRYTPENRREIVESRVNSVHAVCEAIRRCIVPPQALIQSASLAIYGYETRDRWCDESTPAGKGFPAETCIAWEQALAESPTLGTRRVVLRIGFVLGKDGGALKVLAKLARYGLGGTVGSGRHYMSWIHNSDMNRMFLEAIDNDAFEGVFNASGPNPVPNAEFMRELRRATHRPWSPPAPAWAVHIGAWFMGTEGSLALSGWRCAPKRFVESGFTFTFPNLRDALADLCS